MSDFADSPRASAAAALECADVHKSFGDGGERRAILSGVNLKIMPGETLAVAGSSGAGKTTLLHLLGGLDEADRGVVAVGGRDWKSMGAAAAAKTRNKMLGFVFQFHLLLPELSALENAAMPLLIRGVGRGAALEEAADNLRRLGLAAHAQKTPDKLSGGERQRTAVARALAGRPSCLLADEPTGSLDRKNAEAVFDLMLSSAAELNAAVVVVSHDERLAARAARRVSLVDGELKD